MYCIRLYVFVNIDQVEHDMNNNRIKNTYSNTVHLLIELHDMHNTIMNNLFKIIFGFDMLALIQITCETLMGLTISLTDQFGLNLGCVG